MAGKKSITTGANEDSARQQAVIEAAIDAARTRLRWYAALRWLAVSFWLPVLAAAGWVAMVRFTLLDLPRWPIALALAVWFAAYFTWSRRLRITRSQCARYLDAALGLDQRLSTYLELEGRDKLLNLSNVGAIFKNRLASDTAMLLTERMIFLPGRFHCKLNRWPVLISSVAALALLATMLVPTQLDAIKTERDVVRVTMEAQAQKLADLRAEIITRPDIPNDLKQNLASQLDALQKQLRAQQIDRADALATIADVEQNIRSLAPPLASTDFGPVVRAAGLVQNSIADITNSSQASTNELSDLTSTEDAIHDLKPLLKNLSVTQSRRLANDLERAANAATAKDSQLAQNLLDAAAAVRKSDWSKAASALDQASKRFQDAMAQQQSAQAVENTLAKLEDGRQSIAKAGTTASKRGQVGFRRSASAQADSGDGQTANPADTPEADGSSSLAASRIGQNQAAFGSNPGNGQQSGQPGTGGSANTNGQGGGQGGQGGQPTGQSGTSQQPGSAGSGGGAGTGSQGSNLGRINGPIRGAGGSQKPTGDAQGTGISAVGGQAQGGQTGDPQAERVYVPGKDGTQPSGVAGQAAPEQLPSASTSGGRAGEGPAGASSPSNLGLGSVNTIHTPYTQVLGQYSEQAIQALDRAYVPPDAKQYVRDYFAALGK